MNREIVVEVIEPEEQLLVKLRERNEPLLILKGELVRCKDCKYLRVINSIAVYAECAKHGIRFLPFGEDDTRECFCSWAERKEE